MQTNKRCIYKTYAFSLFLWHKCWWWWRMTEYDVCVCVWVRSTRTRTRSNQTKNNNFSFSRLFLSLRLLLSTFFVHCYWMSFVVAFISIRADTFSHIYELSTEHTSKIHNIELARTQKSFLSLNNTGRRWMFAPRTDRPMRVIIIFLFSRIKIMKSKFKTTTKKREKKKPFVSTHSPFACGCVLCCAVCSHSNSTIHFYSKRRTTFFRSVFFICYVQWAAKCYQTGCDGGDGDETRRDEK